MTNQPAKPSDATLQRTVRVLLPLPLGSGYDYLVPPDFAIKIGQFVTVPLGKKESTGVVWANGTGEVSVNP